MKSLVSFLLVSVLFGFSGETPFESNPGDNNWNFKKEKNGIKVYTRDIVGSNLKELKIEMTFEGVPLSNILSIIRDASTYPEWMFKCDNARVVNAITSNKVVSYYKFDFPWPLSDRDAYMQSTISTSPEGDRTKITTVALPKHGEEKEGIVRIEEHVNTWEFTELDQDQIKLSYYIKSHPSGSIPDWAINMAIDKGPTQTLSNLKEMVKQ